MGSFLFGADGKPVDDDVRCFASGGVNDTAVSVMETAVFVPGAKMYCFNYAVGVVGLGTAVAGRFYVNDRKLTKSRGGAARRRPQPGKSIMIRRPCQSREFGWTRDFPGLRRCQNRPVQWPPAARHNLPGNRRRLPQWGYPRIHRES